ncbi:hypothetical protein pipiens_016282 [Culex pipiens pipiens]|uniref:40S ribosomal protein SA n=1 Tax=Culex pipiens pipiens TaxID=38569 RepID=A0ABD1CMB5_CULPP
MELCVFKRRPAGVHIINLGRTLETLLLAARCIASIEYPGEMFTSAQFTPRSVLKFAHYTEATLIAGHFTNQIHPASREPQLLIETDPLTDHQPVVEASYAAQVRQLCHPVQHQVAALGRSDVVPVGPCLTRSKPLVSTNPCSPQMLANWTRIDRNIILSVDFSYATRCSRRPTCPIPAFRPGANHGGVLQDGNTLLNPLRPVPEQLQQWREQCRIKS